MACFTMVLGLPYGTKIGLKSIWVTIIGLPDTLVHINGLPSGY